jgi:serine/threonine protein kinase
VCLQYVAHFNWDRRLEMLHDVAAGMSYLHGKDHVHGDLRSPNLFVGADGKVRGCSPWLRSVLGSQPNSSVHFWATWQHALAFEPT